MNFSRERKSAQAYSRIGQGLGDYRACEREQRQQLQERSSFHNVSMLYRSRSSMLFQHKAIIPPRLLHVNKPIDAHAEVLRVRAKMTARLEAVGAVWRLQLAPLRQRSGLYPAPLVVIPSCYLTI